MSRADVARLGAHAHAQPGVAHSPIRILGHAHPPREDRSRVKAQAVEELLERQVVLRTVAHAAAEGLCWGVPQVAARVIREFAVDQALRVGHQLPAGQAGAPAGGRGIVQRFDSVLRD
jgi:hypothetical protein